MSYVFVKNQGFYFIKFKINYMDVLMDYHKNLTITLCVKTLKPIEPTLQ